VSLSVSFFEFSLFHAADALATANARIPVTTQIFGNLETNKIY
jgi:hypothetical protein